MKSAFHRKPHFLREYIPELNREAHYQLGNFDPSIKFKKSSKKGGSVIVKKQTICVLKPDLQLYKMTARYLSPNPLVSVLNRKISARIYKTIDDISKITIMTDKKVQFKHFINFYLSEFLKTTECKSINVQTDLKGFEITELEQPVKINSPEQSDLTLVYFKNNYTLTSKYNLLVCAEYSNPRTKSVADNLSAIYQQLGFTDELVQLPDISKFQSEKTIINCSYDNPIGEACILVNL